MKEEAYSKEYWEEVDYLTINKPTLPKRRLVDRVLDIIQFTLAQRRADRLFNKEFNNLATDIAKEKEIK